MASRLRIGSVTTAKLVLGEGTLQHPMMRFTTVLDLQCPLLGVPAAERAVEGHVKHDDRASLPLASLFRAEREPILFGRMHRQAGYLRAAKTQNEMKH